MLALADSGPMLRDNLASWLLPIEVGSSTRVPARSLLNIAGRVLSARAALVGALDIGGQRLGPVLS